MQSTQCMKKTTGHCNKTSEEIWLEDKRGRRLPVTTHCREWYNLIWQDKPYNLIGEDLTGSIPYVTRHRFDLFHMSEAEIKEMKDRYLIWQENHFMCDLQKDDTEHHWNYGIE